MDWRKLAFLILAVVSFGDAAFGQGARRDGIVLNSQGRPVPNARVLVCTGAAATPEPTPCTPTASIFSDIGLTTAKSNPITTDANGNYFYYANQTVLYKEQTTGGGLITRTTPDISIGSGSGGLPTGSYTFPGTASGTVTPPVAVPVSSIVLSGGAIADGTYYCKFTYANLNGETTGSPAATITVSGGGGAARVNVGDAGGSDNGWHTGAYGYKIYCSTTSGGTYYLQTPAPVVADFMVDATTHLVRMGDAGARFTSFTFSGTVLPTTNTATIDPIQVALNATRRSPALGADYSKFGTLFIPAVDGLVNPSGQFNPTTPLILGPNDSVLGSGGMNTQVDAQSRIVSSWAANAKLATVMNFGGGATVESVGIQGLGNAYMVLGGAGLQPDHGTRLKDSYLRTTDTTNTYAAFVWVGIGYELHFDNVSMRGGKTAIQYRNAAGGLHYYSNMRLDLGGNSAFQVIPGWTNPDGGNHNGGFSFGVNGIVIEKVRTELGTGIIWDMVGAGVEFGRVEVADLAGGARDSLAKFGTDATYGGTAGPVILRNASFGTRSDARVGTNWVGAAGLLVAMGSSSFGFGSSTGSQLTVDFNSIAGMQVQDYSGAIGSVDPAAAATTPHVINMHDNTFLRTVGDTGGGANVVATNNLFGRLFFQYKTGSNATFAGRTSLLNTGSAFELRASDDATYIFQAPIGTGATLLTNFRNSLQVGIAATNPAIFIGPTALTPAAGTFNGLGLPNQYRIAWSNAAHTGTILGWYVNASDEMESGTAAGVIPSADGALLGKSGKRWNLRKGILDDTPVDFTTIPPVLGYSPCWDAALTLVPCAPSYAFLDNLFSVKDNTDPTKIATIDVGTNVPTGTTVNVKWPSATGTFGVSATAPIVLNGTTGNITATTMGTAPGTKLVTTSLAGDPTVDNCVKWIAGGILGDAAAACGSGGAAGNNSALFTATGDATVSNSAAEATIIGSGVGSKTTAANYFAAGTSLLVRSSGYLSTPAVPDSLTIKIKAGSTVVGTATFTLPLNLANQVFTIESLITCRTAGATGTFMLNDIIITTNATLAATISAKALNTATVTLDTTGTLAWDVTATWGAAQAGETITGTNFVMFTPGTGIADPGANGILARTALNTVSARTITGTSPIGLTNGDGVAGNPTVACATCTTSAAALTANQLVIGSGSQGSQALGTLGTTTTVLHGNAAGAPTFGAVSLTADVSGIAPVSNGGTGLASGTSGGVLAYTAAGTLASSAALAANQIVLGGGAGVVPATLGSLGTTTTVLHGNAAGAPTFGAVAKADAAASFVHNDQVNTGTAAMTLDMAASTSADAHRVPNIPGALPTAIGAIANDTTQKALVAFSNGMAGYAPRVLLAMFCNSTACTATSPSMSLTTGTFTTNCVSGGADASCTNGGSTETAYGFNATFPANTIFANKIYRVDIVVERTATATVPTFTFRAKLGGTTIYQSSANAPAAGGPFGHGTSFLIQGTAAAGASVNVETGVLVSGIATQAQLFSINNTAQPIALATNGTLQLTFTLQLGAATVGNFGRIRQVIITEMF